MRKNTLREQTFERGFQDTNTKVGLYDFFMLKVIANHPPPHLSTDSVATNFSVPPTFPKVQHQQ